MKKLRIVIAVAIICLLGNPLFSQSGLSQLVSGSPADANYLVNGYISPFLKIIGNGLNQGWYNTAQNHKFPGADITFSTSLVAIPSSDKIFTVDNTKLNTVQLTAPANYQIPTFLGSKSASTYTFKPPLTGSFYGPPGLNLQIPILKIPINRLPVPIAQVGIGLPKGIDLKIRYMPPVKLGDGTLNLFGIGIMHDVKQYIPGVKALPFDLSAFAGFTKFKMDVPFSNGASGLFNASSTTIQALISKKLLILTVYGGVGYNLSKVKFDAKGTFDLDGSGPGTATIKDPVSLEASSSGPRATVGMRLKLGPLTLHGDYTTQKYNSITAGIGLSVR